MAQAPFSYFHHLNTEGGLSQANNSFVYHDSRGFVWISSIDGLNRFDGLTIKVYRPNPNNHRAIFGQNIQSPFFEDAHGDLWFCTYEAINCYRRKTDDFDHWQITDSVTSDTIREDYTAFFLEKNVFWLRLRDGDKGTVYTFDTKTRRTTFNGQLLGNRFLVDTTPKGHIQRIYSFFYLNKDRGLYQTDFDAQGKSLNSRLLPPHNFFLNGLYSLLKESDTLLWVANSKGLIAYNPSNFACQIYPLSMSSVKDLKPLTPNTFIVSSGQRGLFVFDKIKRQFDTTFNYTSGRPHALVNGALSELYLDNEKNLWISQWRYGVSFLNLAKSKIRQIPIDSIAPKIPKLIYGLVEDSKGQVWASNYYGELFVFNKYRLTQYYYHNKGLPKENIKRVFADADKNIWVVTEKNLFLYDASADFFQIISPEITRSSDGIYISINQLQDGRLILSQAAMYEVKKSDNKNNYFLTKANVHPNFDKNIVRYFTQVSNGTLFCNFNDNETIAILPDGTIKKFPFVNLSACYEDKTAPYYWLATTYGLVKLNKQDFSYTIYDESKGLPNQYIYSVLSDNKGFLWLSSNKGILRFDPKTETCRQYGLADGIWANEFNTGAWLKTTNGDIWFGNRDALNVFNPDHIQDVQNNPTIQITNLQVNDHNWNRGLNIGEMASLFFPFAENTLSFTFAALEYSDPTNNQLFYKLEGFDRDWVSCRKGALGFARYANLPAGNYLFTIKAVSSDGYSSESPRTIAIEIFPPFYKTWWFLTLVVLATIAIVAYIVYLRLSKVIALQKIRLNLYENLHDDIGSRLTAIVLTVDELMQKAAIKDVKLGLIGTISKNIVANMRRLVWATAPENDALSTVAQQMQTDKRVLLPTGISFQLTMDKSLENLNIGGDKRYQMLSIFNEALTNIAKYAEATTVETRMEIRDKDLIMTIIDNGKGYDPNAKRADTVMSSGHGLRNMQRRANRIKGQLEIASKLGEGTSVKLSFPLQDETVWTKFLSIFSKSYPNRE